MFPSAQNCNASFLSSSFYPLASQPDFTSKPMQTLLVYCLKATILSENMSPPFLMLLQVPVVGVVVLLPMNVLHKLKDRVPPLEVALG